MRIFLLFLLTLVLIACQQSPNQTLSLIVESDEGYNVRAITTALESNSPFLDTASEVVGKTALPFAVIVLTLALLGVVYLVGKGRRDDVNKRIAEQSSLISVLSEDEL